MYGILLRNAAQLEEAQLILRRFRLYPRGLSKSYSVVFTFSDVEDCIRSLQAFDYAKIKARIVFHIIA